MRMQKSLIQMKKIILLLCNAYRKYTKLKLHIETEKLKKKYLHFFEVSSALLLAVKTRVKINFSADREFLMTKMTELTQMTQMTQMTKTTEMTKMTKMTKND